MVHRLILVIVLSGALTAANATVVLILVRKISHSITPVRFTKLMWCQIKVYPASLYYCILEFSLCSLYFSTLLANLNTREYVQSHGGINTVSTFNADYRSDNNALVLGPLTTHSSSGLGGTAASTIQGIQVSMTAVQEHALMEIDTACQGHKDGRSGCIFTFEGMCPCPVRILFLRYPLGS